ncbi:hypothetical protein [Lysobacter enzymogenes]|uniref:hypothetical protein n=1 Tax=Lysobacter enzymogenes TaxID=69 RepID=UPI00089D4961|nr:hypothetical protein [Lysobacter enzymogenes]SDX22545.1 hypothetical protein SAMN05421681_104282 [Lysobacter enzymogenes]
MRIYIIASIMIIIGLVVIAYGGALDQTSWQKPYLSEVSSALLVGGLLSLLFKIFQDKETNSTLRRLLRIHDSVDELGLVEILPEVQGYNFTEMLEDSDQLFVVMNDGQRWVGNYATSLCKRFSKKSTTEFFTVDPASSFVDTLAKKIGSDPAALRSKIEDSWKRIQVAYENSEKKGSVVIYSIETFPTRSIFLTEDCLIETPYQTAAGRAKIPLFKYRRVARSDSPFSFALNDVQQLRKEAKKVIELRPEN